MNVIKVLVKMTARVRSVIVHTDP